MSNISELSRGDKAEIVGFHMEDIPSKFIELGLIHGASIELKYTAPLNGPVCISLCDSKCSLALRKSEAACILVKKSE